SREVGAEHHAVTPGRRRVQLGVLSAARARVVERGHAAHAAGAVDDEEALLQAEEDARVRALADARVREAEAAAPVVRIAEHRDAIDASGAHANEPRGAVGERGAPEDAPVAGRRDLAPAGALA